MCIIEVGEGITLAAYNYNIKTANSKDSIEFGPLQTQFDQKLWEAGLLSGSMQNLARRLVDTPANMMTPKNFCFQVKETLKEEGLESLINVSELGFEEIMALNMNCFLAVSKGSVEPPRLLVLNYLGAKHDLQTHAAIVGKGITFDS